MELNIVGELSRNEVWLNKYEKTADYAQLTPDGKIQMFYAKKHIGYADSTSALVWHYLSYANIWMGSSDDMSKKRLLKLVD
jgi:hypothetical protein